MNKLSKKFCGITPYHGSRTYLYQCMGMRLAVSPAIWQNFITRVLDELPNQKHHVAIMDDCLVHSKKSNHTQELVHIFQVLINNGLKISPIKCQFYRSSLVYMGHNVIILDNKPHVKPERSKIEAITKLKPPTNVKQA